MPLFPFKCKGFCILRRNYAQEKLWGRLGPATTLGNVWGAWNCLESLGEFGAAARAFFPAYSLDAQWRAIVRDWRGFCRVWSRGA
jgi:hypothetical protein